MAKFSAIGALLVGAAFMGLARPASALEPAATLSTVQVLGGPRFGTNDLGFGVGVRGGYTMPTSIYVGGVFDYFFGSTNTVSALGSTVETKTSLWLLGGEIGYDLGLTPQIVLRPIAGIGFASGSAKVCASSTGVPEQCASSTASDPFFELGGSFNWFNGRFMLGGDARLLYVEEGALVLGGHVGVQF